MIFGDTPYFGAGRKYRVNAYVDQLKGQVSFRINEERQRPVKKA
jgi:hypothetical protein